MIWATLPSLVRTGVVASVVEVAVAVAVVTFSISSGVFLTASRLSLLPPLTCEDSDNLRRLASLSASTERSLEGSTCVAVIMVVVTTSADDTAGTSSVSVSP